MNNTTRGDLPRPISDSAEHLVRLVAATVSVVTEFDPAIDQPILIETLRHASVALTTFEPDPDPDAIAQALDALDLIVHELPGVDE